MTERRGLRAQADLLFERNVYGAEDAAQTARIDDLHLRELVIQNPILSPVFARRDVELHRTLRTGNLEHTFPASWNNGTLHLADAISFDYQTPERLIGNAMRWSGRLLELRHDRRFRFIGVCTDPPDRSELANAYERATHVLAGNPLVREIIPISEAAELAATIAADLEADSPR